MSVPYIITNQSLIVNFDDEEITLARGTDTFDNALEVLKSGDEERIKSFFKSASDIENYTENNFRIVDRKVLARTADGEEVEVHGIIARRLADFYHNGLPHEPLVKFWENLQKNPSEESREQLYGFLEHNGHPITDDGCFMAYKKIKKMKADECKNKEITPDTDGYVYVDTHTRRVDNSLGKVVEMNREDVDPDRYNTCSRGLHVAAWDYAAGYGGNMVVKIKVNPADVVAVPNDYNNQKMRVCRYEIVEYGLEDPVLEPYDGEYSTTFVCNDCGEKSSNVSCDDDGNEVCEYCGSDNVVEKAVKQRETGQTAKKSLFRRIFGGLLSDN